MSTKTTYKQTELGLIPEDWEVKKLGDLVNIKSGDSPTKFKLSESNGKYPYLKVEDLNNCNKYQSLSRNYSNDKFSIVKENDYNLNIPRYVDTYEEEAEIDLAEVQQKIAQLQNELADVQKQMDEYLKLF